MLIEALEELMVSAEFNLSKARDEGREMNAAYLNGRAMAIREVITLIRNADEKQAAMVAGWNACRKSLFAVCEDVQSENERHRSDTENPPRHHFGRGGMSAAKSIARGFGAMEAMDDDNLLAALRGAS